MKNFKVIMSFVALIAVSNVKPLTMKEKIAAAKEATTKGATGATTTQEPTLVAPTKAAVAPKEGPAKKLTMKEKIAAKAEAAKGGAATKPAKALPAIPKKQQQTATFADFIQTTKKDPVNFYSNDQLQQEWFNMAVDIAKEDPSSKGDLKTILGLQANAILQSIKNVKVLPAEDRDLIKRMVASATALPETPIKKALTSKEIELLKIEQDKQREEEANFIKKSYKDSDFVFSNLGRTAIRTSWIQEAVRIQKVLGTPKEEIKKYIVDNLKMLAAEHKGTFQEFPVGIAIDNALGEKIKEVVAPQKQIVSSKVIQPVQKQQQLLQATAKTKIAPLLPKKPITEQPSPMPKKLPEEPIDTSKIQIQSTERTPEKPAIELTPLARYKIETLELPSTFYSTNGLQLEWFVEAVKLARLVRLPTENIGPIYTMVAELAQELRDELSKNNKVPKNISNDDIFDMTQKGAQFALQEETYEQKKEQQPPVETQPRTNPAKASAPLPKTLGLYKIATLRNPSTFYQGRLQQEWFINAIKIAIDDPANSNVDPKKVYGMVYILAQELRAELSKNDKVPKDISNDDISEMTMAVRFLPQQKETEEETSEQKKEQQPPVENKKVAPKLNPEDEMLSTLQTQPKTKTEPAKVSAPVAKKKVAPTNKEIDELILTIQAQPKPKSTKVPAPVAKKKPKPARIPAPVEKKKVEPL